MLMLFRIMERVHELLIVHVPVRVVIVVSDEMLHLFVNMRLEVLYDHAHDGVGALLSIDFS